MASQVLVRRRTSLLEVGLLLLLLPMASLTFSPPSKKLATTKHGRYSNDFSSTITMMMNRQQQQQQQLLASNDNDNDEILLSTVVVAGATGRTGRLVVEELLARGVPQVLALVRDTERAQQVLGGTTATPQLGHGNNNNLKIVPCDLSKEADVRNALESSLLKAGEKNAAIVWCASGFSNGEADTLGRVKRLLGMALTPKKSIDVVGLPALAKALADTQQPERIPQNKGVNKTKTTASTPQIVLCSSAGVTRPTWDASKRQQFIGAADIPIVRLNPFGILDAKRQGEIKLRETCQALGVRYCIVRPTGLVSDDGDDKKWPAGSRPILTQGDVAVGRTHRQDLAKLLVDVLTAPEATDKTFEACTLAGYTPAVSIRPALGRLLTDQEGLPSDETVAATYHTLQQLLPGEQQDSAALAMGQTYEQLDKGETGRLGKRGEENVAVAQSELAGTRS